MRERAEKTKGTGEDEHGPEGEEQLWRTKRVTSSSIEEAERERKMIPRETTKRELKEDKATTILVFFAVFNIR